MSIFISYLQVFLVGGLVCLIGQLLINLTKITSAKILVTFLLLGVILEAVGIFQYVKDFGGAGITVPITGFGSTMVKGTIEAVAEKGLLGALTGGITAGAAGLSAAIFFGFIISMIFKPHTKT